VLLAVLAACSDTRNTERSTADQDAGGGGGPAAGTGAAGGQPSQLPPKPTSYGIDLGAANRASLLPGDGTWDVEIDASGSVVVGGPEQKDFLDGVSVSKFALNRTLSWTKWVRLGSDGHFGSLTFSKDGGILICGSFEGQLDVDGHTLESTVNPGTSQRAFDDRGQPSLDMFLLKLTASGAVAWLRRFGGVSEQTCRSVLRAMDGSLILVGSFAGRLELGAQSLTSTYGSTGWNVVIAKLDQAGEPISAQQLDAIGNIRDALLDSQGNLILASMGGRTPEGDALGAGWVAKVDASGSWLWATSFDMQVAPEPVRLAVDTTDNILVVSSVYDQNAMFFGKPVGDAGIALAKLDSNGNLIFAKTFGSYYLDHAWGLAAGANDSILMTGGYYRSVDFGGGTLENVTPDAYNSDVFVAMLKTSGDHQFSFSAGGEGSDSGTGIAATANQIVATGTFESGIDFGNNILQARYGSYILWMDL
jgi:hypothetical protein